MANFLTDLSKGFVRSAVNQVGRDYGKTISNQIFGDAHSTPIRMVRVDRNYQPSAPGTPNQENAIEYHKQDIINWQDITCLILSPLCVIFGPLMYIPYTLYYLFSRSTQFVVWSSCPKYISDKRYKYGYRIEPQGVHKERMKIANRYLDTRTIAKGKIRGIVWLAATAINIYVNILLYQYATMS